MLSGRSTAVVSGGGDTVDDIIGRCCSRLQIQKTGTTALVHGMEVVAGARVHGWPGLRPQGE
eukprot:4686148-Amphidinium_carterae.1